MSEPPPMPKVRPPKVECKTIDKTIDIEELKVICDLTVRLTELRQNECKHLCVENFASKCFSELLTAIREAGCSNITTACGAA